MNKYISYQVLISTIVKAINEFLISIQYQQLTTNICEMRKSYYSNKNILYCYFKNFNSLIDEYEFLSNSLNKIFKNNNKEIKNLLLKK